MDAPAPKKSPFKKLLMLSVALLALIAFVYILITPGLKPVVVTVYVPPIITAEQRVVDVGSVLTDSKVSARFVLYNKGGYKLRIGNIETSCGCTVAQVSKKVIAPGEMTRLTATLDTSIKMGKTRKKITVYSNDPKRPALELFLTGNVLPKPMMGHKDIMMAPKDRLVLFKGECATCHVQKGIGKTGKALFLADCAMCHGGLAQGNHSAGPSLLSANFDDAVRAAKMRKIIAGGSPDSPQMAPFSKANGGPLTDDEIDSLISFLKFQNLQSKLGRLNQQDPAELEDTVGFEKALQSPH